HRSRPQEMGPVHTGDRPQGRVIRISRSQENSRDVDIHPVACAKHIHASVPDPKFARLLSRHFCELRVWVRKIMAKQVLAPASPALSGAISPARAGEINVLSGAAVEPGLLAAADIFRQRTGHNVRITFATTPEIRRLFGAGATPDVVIAPPAALDELAKSGKVDGTARVSLGRVGVGVVIRDGAPKPDVS